MVKDDACSFSRKRTSCQGHEAYHEMFITPRKGKDKQVARMAFGPLPNEYRQRPASHDQTARLRPSCWRAVTPSSKPISSTILPFSIRSTVVPVNRIFRPVEALNDPMRKSLKAGPVCVPPPSQRPTTYSPSAIRSAAPQKLRSGNASRASRHECLDVLVATTRCMKRIVQEHVRSGEFIDDAGIVGFSPELREPASYNCLVFIFF